MEDEVYGIKHGDLSQVQRKERIWQGRRQRERKNEREREREGGGGREGEGVT